MDAHNPLLHGDLKEEVYMKFHYGFEHPNPTKVFCLRKSIYGLKQSLCYWFAKLIKVIVSNRAGPTTHTSRSLRETYVYTS